MALTANRTLKGSLDGSNEYGKPGTITLQTYYDGQILAWGVPQGGILAPNPGGNTFNYWGICIRPPDVNPPTPDVLGEPEGLVFGARRGTFWLPHEGGGDQSQVGRIAYAVDSEFVNIVAPAGVSTHVVGQIVAYDPIMDLVLVDTDVQVT